MRHVTCFIACMALLWLSGCDDNESNTYSESANPEITVVRDELYSVPNRQFTIKANLKDDLGLKSIQIQIPEFSLDKMIEFSTDELLTTYDLVYKFLAPKDAEPNKKYDVKLTLTDVSGNSVTKELQLHLDGDFAVPVVANLKPSNGTVLLKTATETMTLTVSFDVTDETGVGEISVQQQELGIDEKIDAGSVKSFHFEKSYDIPSELASYALSIKVSDTFIEPNTETMIVNFDVAEGLTNMYLADVPLGTDLQADDIFGVPMYYHSQVDGVFSFKYYADTDGKELYFLGQESSFEPHCFGYASDGVLLKSSSATPIVLPRKGYYKIEVNPVALTYTVTPYIPESTIFATGDVNSPNQKILVANGATAATANISWDIRIPDANTLLTSDPARPYILKKDVELTGGDVQITVTAPGWNPFWRLNRNGVAIFCAGENSNYKGKAGLYEFTLDTELERMTLKKK